MASRAHLVREILKELGVHQAGQDLPPEDYRVVDERLPFEVAAMRRLDIYWLDDLDSIPDEALVEMAKYIAGQFVSVFGLTGDEAAAIMAGQQASDRALRYMRVQTATGARMKAEYF
jgi:hypothetical protein